MSKLIFEEKTWEIAANMDLMNRQQLCKMVTKNLLYLIHSRRHFGISLDLKQDTMIVDALTDHIKDFIVNEKTQVKRETQARIYHKLDVKQIKKNFKKTIKKVYP